MTDQLGSRPGVKRRQIDRDDELDNAPQPLNIQASSLRRHALGSHDPPGRHRVHSHRLAASTHVTVW